MPFQIIRQDITKMHCDAIVNAANNSLLGGGGVDGAIHRAAGPELLEECRTLGGCATGKVKMTGGYHLPAKYVIHTVGPIWRGGTHGEPELLRSCYENALKLAAEHGFESIAFPLISAGVYGYPKGQAVQIAVETISRFLLDHEMQVYLLIFGKADYLAGSQLFSEIQSFIDDHYVEAHSDLRLEQRRRANQAREALEAEDLSVSSMPMMAPSMGAWNPGAYIDDQLDESFSQMVLRKIDEVGMTDVQCYKKANLDRKLFSKIRSNLHYQPSKPTAIALAVALELPLEETRDLLQKAGFALSHSNKFDLIVEYFIRNGNYDVYQINEVLFAFDQALLGA